MNRSRLSGRNALVLKLVAVMASLAFFTSGCEKKPAKDGGGGGDKAKEASGGDGGAAPSGGGEKMAWTAPANPATIKGKVVLEGAAPTMADLVMTKPECVALHTTPPKKEFLVTGAGGGLKDVFVHVTGGLEKYESIPVPEEPAVLNQKGCLYVPHVFGVMVNQDIEIRNGDPLLHNVNVTEQRGFNTPQGEGAPPITKPKWFKRAQIPIAFKCEVHDWMKSYACVVDNPFHAVSDKDGNFTISGLPAGKYTLEFWHEEIPGLAPASESVEVEVAEGETKEITIKYSL